MIEQGTGEWKQQRLGKVTASRVSDVIAQDQDRLGREPRQLHGRTAVRAADRRAAEQLRLGAMQWGLDTSQSAGPSDYELMLASVEIAGLRIGLSSRIPSSPWPVRRRTVFIGDDGLIEIKCPNTATHIETLLGPRHSRPTTLRKCSFRWPVTGRQWCDFVSFDPRLPPAMQLFVKRVPRDQDMIENLDSEVIKFLAELDAKEAELRSRYAMDKAA